MNEESGAVPEPSEPQGLSLAEVWPPAGLRIESPRLMLRLLQDHDMSAYLAAASSPIAHTQRNPFVRAWNEVGREDLVRNSFSWIWQARTRMDQEDLLLLLGVFEKDPEALGGERLIGCQDVGAEQFAVQRTVLTGSWLIRARQGIGLGREMRAAVLLWAFDHLGARWATSGAYVWNRASIRVSESLGYQENGRRIVTDATGERAEEEIRFRVDAQSFIRPDWEIAVEGHERFARFARLPLP